MIIWNMCVAEEIVVCFKILTQHFPGGTEEDHANNLVRGFGFLHENGTRYLTHVYQPLTSDLSKL
jgi:hypothetical protein